MKLFLLFLEVAWLFFPFRLAAEKPERARIDSVNAIPYAYIVSNLLRSVTIFEKNLRDARAAGYRMGEAVALEKLALATGMSRRGDSEKYQLEALRIYEQLGAPEALSMAYAGYGFGQKRRDLSLAQRYMWKGLRLAEEKGLEMNLTTIYDNYGYIKRMQGKADSALHYYQKALKLKRALGDSVGIPYSLNKIAQEYRAVGDFVTAVRYLRESDRYRRREEGDFGRSENLLNWAELHEAMGRPDSAILRYHRAINLGKSISYKQAVEYGYEQLARIYERRGDPARALENHKRYTAYRDSILNIETNAKVAELEMAYQTEKKDKLLSEQALELENKSLLLMLLAVSLILAVVVFGALYAIHKKRRERLAWESRVREERMRRQMAEQKLRISRELHDNIGSNLTFIINALDDMKEKAGPEAARIEEVRLFGRETMDDLRQTIWAVKEEQGDSRLMLIKLRELVRRVGATVGSPRVEIDPGADTRHSLSSALMLDMYRFAQEALQNAIKHAHASRVVIRFSSERDGMELSVRDDGRGFDPAQASPGYGLENMRARCENAGGRFRVESSARGTTLFFTIALK